MPGWQRLRLGSWGGGERAPASYTRCSTPSPQHPSFPSPTFISKEPGVCALGKQEKRRLVRTHLGALTGRLQRKRVFLHSTGVGDGVPMHWISTQLLQRRIRRGLGSGTVEMAPSWDCPVLGTQEHGTTACILWGNYPRTQGPERAGPFRDAPESSPVALGIGHWPGISVSDENWTQCHNHGQVGENMRASCGGQYFPALCLVS